MCSEWFGSPKPWGYFLSFSFRSLFLAFQAVSVIADQEAGCWPLEIGCSEALQGGINGGLGTWDCSLWKQADLNSPTRDVTASCSVAVASIWMWLSTMRRDASQSVIQADSTACICLCVCVCVNVNASVIIALTILCLRCFLRSLMNSLCCLETKLTAAYSNNAANTNSRQTAIQMSMAFT